VTPRSRWAAEGRQGKARLSLVTTDLAAALAGTEVVIAPLPATGHDDLAGRLAPHVNAVNPPVHPGNARQLRDGARARPRRREAAVRARRDRDAAVPRAEDRRHERLGAVRAANLPLGVFPASRVEPTRARLAELFPSIRPCADALDAALTNTGR